MKRTKHSLSHYQLATFDMGKLIPVSQFSVLPGDSIRMSTSCLLRVSPLLAPVMHPVTVRLHHWFVPYRILDENWEDFITGVTGATPPEQFSLTAANLAAGKLGNYLGLPPITGANTVSANKFPFLAYTKIFNEFYRDQDLVTEVPDTNLDVQNVAWEKDYFTAARPWTQKGGDVTIPLGGLAPVRGLGTIASESPSGVSASIVETDRGGISYASSFITNLNDVLRVQADGGGVPQVYANLSGGTTSAQVIDVRRAFALQRYQEARAQYGSRYAEYLRYLGVRSSDARLQRPEYLGGGKATVQFSEVLRTGNQDDADTDTPVGQLRGHGVSALRSRRWVRFFEEHGVVLTLCSLRPRAIYQDGVHREWIKQSKEDYWQKELELIGQQEIQNQEVYADVASASQIDTFGYGDRYSEYRTLPSLVTGEFQSTLNFWHMARQFASAPTLNDDFITCDPTKRVLADQTSHSIWGMFSHSVQARRMVGDRTVGKVM